MYKFANNSILEELHKLLGRPLLDYDRLNTYMVFSIKVIHFPPEKNIIKRGICERKNLKETTKGIRKEGILRKPFQGND